MFFFFLIIPRRPRSTLFPYTTLFRSGRDRGGVRLPGLGGARGPPLPRDGGRPVPALGADRKSTRLNSSHVETSYAVFCLKKKTSNSLPRSHLKFKPTFFLLSHSMLIL